MFSLVWKIYYGSYPMAVILILLTALAGAAMALYYDTYIKLNENIKAGRLNIMFRMIILLILTAGSLIILWITIFGRTWGILRVIHIISGKDAQSVVKRRYRRFENASDEYGNVCSFGDIYRSVLQNL